ncbi:hypothetical protein M758_11G078500 [Ceratodon purpureus]|nr:hypothetical protein M758_11G078500 [Ceratodon purpureus]
MTQFHMHLCCCSRNSAISYAGGTHLRSVLSSGPPWTFPREVRLTGRIRSSNERLGRLSGLTRLRWRSSVVRGSSSSQLGLAGSEMEEVERARKQIFEEGFAVFPQMWSKEEVAEAGVGTLVVGGGQEKVLKSFLVDAVDVQSQ